MCVARFVFPAAILYIAFQGLVTDVKLQNYLHDLIFSRLIAAAYSAFEAKYCPFRCARSSLFFFIR